MITSLSSTVNTSPQPRVTVHGHLLLIVIIFRRVHNVMLVEIMLTDLIKIYD